MAKKNPYKAYQKASVQTSDPIKLVVMLYEGSIRNLRQAIGHVEASRKQDASERISKTLDIINYLANCLDMEAGGEVSENLVRLYDYLRETLGEANLHLDIEKIDGSIAVLQTLLEGWQGIVQKSAAETNPDLPQAPDQPSNLSMVG